MLRLSYLVAFFAVSASACVATPWSAYRPVGGAEARVWPDSAVFRIPVGDSGDFQWGGPPPGRFDYLFSASWLDTVSYRERGVGWIIQADSGTPRRKGPLRAALRAGHGVWFSFGQCGSLNCLAEVPEQGIVAHGAPGMVTLTVRHSSSLDSLLRARPDSVTLREEGLDLYSGATVPVRYDPDS